MKKTIQIIYDGHCPFCRNFTKLLKLKANFNVVLTDARQDIKLSKKLLEDGFNLDKGMLVKLEGQNFFGYKAMFFLAGTSSNSNIVNRIFSILFSNKRLASLIYPILVLGRNIVLFLLNRKKIFSK